MKNKIIFFVFVFLQTFFQSCLVPPRCRVPNCHVIIDHHHAIGSFETEGAKTDVMQVYRGMPWYRYLFRKQYRVSETETEQKIKGKYRKIDTREAYDKN
jgi:hypothetical protein